MFVLQSAGLLSGSWQGLTGSERQWPLETQLGLSWEPQSSRRPVLPLLLCTHVCCLPTCFKGTAKSHEHTCRDPRGQRGPCPPGGGRQNLKVAGDSPGGGVAGTGPAAELARPNAKRKRGVCGSRASEHFHHANHREVHHELPFLLSSCFTMSNSLLRDLPELDFWIRYLLLKFIGNICG